MNEAKETQQLHSEEKTREDEMIWAIIKNRHEKWQGNKNILPSIDLQNFTFVTKDDVKDSEHCSEKMVKDGLKKYYSELLEKNDEKHGERKQNQERIETIKEILAVYEQIDIEQAQKAIEKIKNKKELVVAALQLFIQETPDAETSAKELGQYLNKILLRAGMPIGLENLLNDITKKRWTALNYLRAKDNQFIAELPDKNYFDMCVQAYKETFDKILTNLPEKDGLRFSEEEIKEKKEDYMPSTDLPKKQLSISEDLVNELMKNVDVEKALEAEQKKSQELDNKLNQQKENISAKIDKDWAVVKLDMLKIENPNLPYWTMRAKSKREWEVKAETVKTLINQLESKYKNVFPNFWNKAKTVQVIRTGRGILNAYLLKQTFFEDINIQIHELNNDILTLKQEREGIKKPLLFGKKKSNHAISEKEADLATKETELKELKTQKDQLEHGYSAFENDLRILITITDLHQDFNDMTIESFLQQISEELKKQIESQVTPQQEAIVNQYNQLTEEVQAH